METTEMEQSMQWFVFFKDQLLLKKEYTTNGENKSIPDTLLGQPQPFLSRMRHSYGTADSYHEEMPGVRQ